jgi:phage tail sheath protein FI
VSPDPVQPVGPSRRPEFDEVEIALLQQEVLTSCENRGDRVALLDSPQSPQTSPADALTWRAQFDSAFGALYYPWLLVADPLSADDAVTAVPPSGHLAGVCARVDRSVGVHEPPANEVVPLAVDAVSTVDDVAHGDLNDGSVNAIRPVRGVRVLGARTLTRNLPEWRYLNVRRLVLALEEQIAEETAWTVFEPNDSQLWREVDRAVRGVLEPAWQQGMLTGATRKEAYTVTCDATVNPPADVAAGKLVCVVGLNPPPPAEFVVVRIVRTPTGVSVLEGASNG